MVDLSKEITRQNVENVKWFPQPCMIRYGNREMIKKEIFKIQAEFRKM